LFLTLEHLCAYHQPEVVFFLKIIFFRWIYLLTWKISIWHELHFWCVFSNPFCSFLPWYFFIQLITLCIAGAEVPCWSHSDGSSVCCSISK
jgi:hypothetical protein